MTDITIDDNERMAKSGTLYSDGVLLQRAMNNCARRAKRRRDSLWVIVGEEFSCGSTLAHGLCRRFGFDPDQ